MSSNTTGLARWPVELTFTTRAPSARKAAKRPSVCDAAPELLGSNDPEAAQREWMNRFIAHLTTKRDLKDALQAVIALGVNPFEHSRAKPTEAITLLTPLGATAQPLDVMALLVAVAQNQDADQAKRLLDLVMAGILHGAARTAR